MRMSIPTSIPAENVVGRFYFKVDNAGRVVEYLKTPLGFILLGLCRLGAHRSGDKYHAGGALEGGRPG